MGKYLEITFDGKGKDQKAVVLQMCEKLLANPIIEEYHITA